MLTLAVVSFMFTVTFINWIIDIVNLNIEARLTLIDNPDVDLGTKYDDALQIVFHWTSIQTMLCSYLVRLLLNSISWILLLMLGIVQRRGRDYYLESVCFLVWKEGETSDDHTLRDTFWLLW